MTGIGMAREPRVRGMRRTLIATALVGIVLGIFLLGGGWKWGWFGTKANEKVFDLGNGVKLALCWCPPGKFLMGSPATEAGREANEVQHEVTLTQGFWMAKTETTQAQWKALMQDNPSAFKGGSLPVDSVTWDEAMAFVAALTARLSHEGKLDAGWEFRLPTEAQWEYACRAGTSTAYFTGDGEEALRKAGWYDGNSFKKVSKFRVWLESLPLVRSWIRVKSGGSTEVQPVGGKEENAFGLNDMHGSVWEWCEDWCDVRYPHSEAGGVVDPAGPRDGRARVIRGGSWDDDPAWCRSAYRPEGGELEFRYRALGFRVCLVPRPAGEEAEN